MRIDRFLSDMGIASRRESAAAAKRGQITVDGVVVRDPSKHIDPEHVSLAYMGRAISYQKYVYVMLNKPEGYVSATEDSRLPVVTELLSDELKRMELFPVGRLDRNTTGVLLLTNDGDLASKLTHPKYVKKKIYHVWCDKDISEDDMQRIADGIELEDGPIHADAISYATETAYNQAGIEIHSGRNRIVRRIFESLGYHVTKLDRVYFAGLTKKNLPRGRWRYLTQEEVNFLKMGSFE